MNYIQLINRYFKGINTALENVDKSKIELFIEILSLHRYKKTNIFVFGNGGSGVTASHAVCDFNKSVPAEIGKRFRFICLNENIPSLLAYGNDVAFEDIFLEQLKNYLEPEDLVIPISCSGNSKNVIKAVKYAKQLGAETFSFCGFDGGRLLAIDPVNSIHISINDMQIVEDCHAIILHMVCQILNKKLSV